MREPTPRPDSPPTPAVVLRDLAWTVHRRIPEVEGFHPLPTTELAVLRHVLESPGMTVTELARHLGLQQSNASAAVRALMLRGLLVRETSATDRRVAWLRPTDEALTEHVAIAAAWSGPIQQALELLEPGDAAAIAAASSALAHLDRALRDQQTVDAPQR